METSNPLDTNEGRTLLAFMRLAVNRNDCLAWRTLFQVWYKGIGEGAIEAVYDLARHRGLSFAQALFTSYKHPSLLPSNYQSRISEAIRQVLERLSKLFAKNVQEKYETCKELMDVIQKASESLIRDKEIREFVLMELSRSAEPIGAKSIEELVRATEVVSEDIEQEIEKGKVNILTMHRAKGLTAEAVIVAAVEDQYIPGRAQGDAVDDERRLLYVSLTRAKHHLFMTYCDKRTGPQRHTGRDSGRVARSLSQFLRDCPYTPEIGSIFTVRLAKENK
jgi:DNA helicase-2/ATP-dependent DNA helicase PcrA